MPEHCTTLYCLMKATLTHSHKHRQTNTQRAASLAGFLMGVLTTAHHLSLNTDMWCCDAKDPNRLGRRCQSNGRPIGASMSCAQKHVSHMQG